MFYYIKIGNIRELILFSYYPSIKLFYLLQYAGEIIMNLLKVSVIIPIYNTEIYLKQCLDSVINQTFKDFECICINDGSTDNSLSILKEYISKDTRFKLIDKKNEGVSVARNTGIQNASAKYILFVDSDDWITKNHIEVLYDTIEKYDCDLVSSDAYFYDNQTKKTYLKRPQNEFFNRIITSTETKKKLLALGNIWGSWGKIYKKEFLTKNDILFRKCVMEDILFIYEVILASKSIMFIDKLLYFYRKNIINSATSNNNGRIYIFIDLFKTLRQTLIKKNNYDAYKKTFVSHVIKCFAFELEESKLPLKTLNRIFIQIKNEFLDEKTGLFYPDNIPHKIRILVFQFCLRYNINYATVGKFLKKVYFLITTKQN